MTKEYSKVSGDQLAQLLARMSDFQSVQAEVSNAVKASPDKVNHILSHDSHWADLYELPFSEHLTLVTVGLGLAPAILEAAASDDPQQTMIDKMGEDLPEWNHGPDGSLEENDLFALVTSVSNSLASLMTYGRYLNDLVADAREGNDKALFDAVRIDRSIVSAPTIAARIAKAEIKGDDRFFKKLRNAMKGRPHKQWAGYDVLRYIFQVLHEAGSTDLSDKQLEELFIKQLKLYPNQGSEPVRNLRKLFTTWKKKATT